MWQCRTNHPHGVASLGAALAATTRLDAAVAFEDHIRETRSQNAGRATTLMITSPETTTTPRHTATFDVLILAGLLLVNFFFCVIRDSPAEKEGLGHKSSVSEPY